MAVEEKRQEGAEGFSPWCPRCRWYKGLKEPRCPRCGFDEVKGEITAAEERPPREKAMPSGKAAALIVAVILAAFGAGYMALQNPGRGTAPSFKTAAPMETTTSPVSTTRPSLSPAPSSGPVNTSDVATPDVTGSWIIASANLSSFSDLHFIGDAEFNRDGTYTLNTNPREFDRSEGVIVYRGRYAIEGLEIKGGGKSTIYQRGKVFGAPATDTLTARIDPSGRNITGVLESISSSHTGGEAGRATLDFVLVRQAQ
ncbi:MAG: hypothetical protein D6733_05200 [Methanobacteriota archaeon]|nr:MAG: hypothetical protein D6733_05200 [Euryarchaeota archaeon]